MKNKKQIKGKIKILDKIETRKLKDDEKPIPQDIKNGGLTSESKKLAGISWLQKRKLNKKPEHSFIIFMIYSNGTSRRFIITTEHETFNYRKRTYNLRYEDSLFSLTDNQFILIYHEDFVNPIDRKIIKIGNEAYFSTTPENIKSIIDMEYVKALSSSIELNKFFRSSLVLSIINLFLLLITIVTVFKISKIIKLAIGGA